MKKPRRKRKNPSFPISTEFRLALEQAEQAAGDLMIKSATEGLTLIEKVSLAQVIPSVIKILRSTFTKKELDDFVKGHIGRDANPKGRAQ